MSNAVPNLEESVWKRAGALAWKGELWKVGGKRVVALALGLVFAYGTADEEGRAKFFGRLETAVWGFAGYAAAEAALYVYYVMRAGVLQRNELREWARAREKDPASGAIRELKKMTLGLGEFRTDALEVFRSLGLLLSAGLDGETIAHSIAFNGEESDAELRGKLIVRGPQVGEFPAGPQSNPFFRTGAQPRTEEVHAEIRSWAQTVVGTWGAAGVVTTVLRDVPSGKMWFYVMSPLGSDVWRRLREDDNPPPFKKEARF